MENIGVTKRNLVAMELILPESIVLIIICVVLVISRGISDSLPVASVAQHPIELLFY
jgi:hypothetical protein